MTSVCFQPDALKKSFANLMPLFVPCTSKERRETSAWFVNIAFKQGRPFPNAPDAIIPSAFHAAILKKPDPERLFIEISGLDKAVDLLSGKFIIILFVTLIKGYNLLRCVHHGGNVDVALC